MRRVATAVFVTILLMLFSISSYGSSTPYDDIVCVITATENKLYHAKSFKEIENLQFVVTGDEVNPESWTQLKGSWQIIDDNYIEYEAR